MHILIRVLVPASDPTEAVGVARFALDRLIGIGEGASTAIETAVRGANRTADNSRMWLIRPCRR